MMPSFTLGPSWIDQYVSSIILVNTLLGHSMAAPAVRPATPEAIIQTLQEIARGRYKPEPGSSQFGGVRELTTQPPALPPAQTYLLIVLNASTPAGDFVSVETGGIVFEDPAWAVLAAYAIAQSPRLAVPLASDNADLWRRLGRVQTAIRSGNYIPRDFFGAITGFVPTSSQPEFRLIQATSEQINALRSRGLQSFGAPLRFYELFQRPKQGTNDRND